MSLALSLHEMIVKYNVLTQPTAELDDYLWQHPNLYKVVLLVNHLFRAVAMAGLMLVLPFPMLVNSALCFVGSLFYRLTVETHCAYKFALPAYAGSIALPMGLTACAELITGVAFASLGAFVLALASLLTLAAYLSYIVLTVSYDVDHR